jgi:hypothetical protein
VEEFLNLCDFQFVALSVPCSRLDPHTMKFFCLLFWAMNFLIILFFITYLGLWLP